MYSFNGFKLVNIVGKSITISLICYERILYVSDHNSFVKENYFEELKHTMIHIVLHKSIVLE